MISNLDSLISGYVAKDATAFCTYEQYQEAVSAFLTMGELRAKSVQGQLDGTVPSTNEDQEANATALVNSEDLQLSVLGNMGGGRGGTEGGDPDRGAAFAREWPGEQTIPVMAAANLPNAPNAPTSEAVYMPWLWIGVSILLLLTSIAFVSRLKRRY